MSCSSRDKEDHGNRGITLLSVVGKMLCKFQNNRIIIQQFDKGRVLYEGSGRFQFKEES